ncbi:hypothetical protein ABZ249_17815 [Nocardiopsis sp. NPDC006139]|uniref:hypothetical protein n=1 Tax=unclassified Nocardiopsis TaxID=2649073 RepID=UPI0033AD2775
MSDAEVSLTKVEEDVLLSLDALEYENKPMTNFFGPGDIAGYPDLTTDVDAVRDALVTLVEKNLVSEYGGQYQLGSESSDAVWRVKRKRGEI